MQDRFSDMADGRLDEAARTASSAVRQAAEVLEEQLSGGLTEVRRITDTLASGRRLDRAAFEDLVARFRTTAHELVDAAAQRMEDLKTDEAQNLAQRFTKDAHDLLDTVVDLVAVAPSLVGSISGRGGARATDEHGNVDPNTGPRPPVPVKGGGPTGGGV